MSPESNPKPQARVVLDPDRVRDALVAADRSRASIARELDLPEATLHRWANQITTAPAATVRRIEMILGVEPGTLEEHGQAERAAG